MRGGRSRTHTSILFQQYDRALVQQIADLCHAGWGEIEIHLHHGVTEPATAESTREQLVRFRDTLAHDHGCLSYKDGDSSPVCFVHGNFALANLPAGLGAAWMMKCMSSPKPVAMWI